MPRLEYLTRDDVPDEYEELFEVDEDNPDDMLLNVHRAMANNPRLCKAWGEWSWTVYEEVGDSRIRELAILAVAREVGSRYVWHQHVPSGLEAGLSREELQAIHERRYDEFAATERAILEYVSAFLDDSIDDDVHARLASSFSEEVVVALIFLVSEYLQMSKVIESMAIDLETDFVGWQLENLD